MQPDLHLKLQITSLHSIKKWSSHTASYFCQDGNLAKENYFKVENNFKAV
jgi:hypothetical protein